MDQLAKNLNSSYYQIFAMALSKSTQKLLGVDEFSSNQEIITSLIHKYPGLRFHEIKKEIKLANGTLQHHLSQLTKSNTIKAKYMNTVPRYYAYDLEDTTQTILLRLRQNTTSRIIKSLLKNECQTFGQIVTFSKKSPGTVSIYKNMLLKDRIIIGDTNSCECNKREGTSKIKYRLMDEEKIHMILQEYGKTPLQKSADNLADVFLSIK